MAKLTTNHYIPNLAGNTYSGKSINLHDYIGRPLILSFYRYAGCQLCNLRMRDFIKNYNEFYKLSGINALAVFQSPVNKMEKNLYKHHDIPFDVISDPNMKWYRDFGLERSWGGFLRTIGNMNPFIKSMAAGYAKIDPDGPINRLPADFLISKDGKIEDTFYAKDISEHIPFKRIDAWISKDKN